MLVAKRVRPEWRDKDPGHRSCRRHGPRADSAQGARTSASIGCCKEFDALTGVPVLLNTSFNVKGEPIVETPRDAVACFLGTGIDYLTLRDGS